MSCTHYAEKDGDTSSRKVNYDSDCFLTTACMIWKGKSDDCEELQILRKYRDTYLNSFEAGRKDVVQYYQLAPSVVESIMNDRNRDNIFESIYTELVVYCSELIKEGKYAEAHEYYRDYVFNLYGDFFN